MTSLRTNPSLLPLWAAMAAWFLLVSSCGFGTGVLLGGSGGGGGGAPAGPASFLVMDYKTSPATIRLVLAGDEDSAVVDFFYATSDAPGIERPMQHVAGGSMPLTMSPAGVVHLLAWDFALEGGLAAGPLTGVTVIARAQDGDSWALVTNLGGDLPIVDAVELPGPEVTGVVPVNFRVADVSGDVVDVRVEFTTDSGPAAGWQPARPHGTSGPVNGPAFEGIVTTPGGVGLTFYWDTDSHDGAGVPVGDLADRESNVRLRFIAEEREVREPSGTVIVPAFSGQPAESPVFRVDNNDAPLAVIDDSALQANTDRLRGIPIYYRTNDLEADPIPVLFQWSRPGQTPPVLGAEADTPEELLGQVGDRAFRQRMQICTPYPVAVGGRPIPVDAARVRLPELSRPDLSWLLARGMRGLEIEVLRPEAGAWDEVAAGLGRVPVATSPTGDGLTAFVLAQDGATGSAVLAEIDLVTGAELRPATVMAGTPTALAVTADGRSALVATDQGGLWRLFEVTAGESTLLTSAANPPGPIRAIAAVGSRTAVATAGASLLRIDWVDSNAPRVVTVSGGLSTPWGVAVDRRQHGRVFVAESTHAGVGRIITVDLASHATAPVPAQVLPQPTSLALQADGAGLRVLCQGTTGPEVRTVRFGPTVGAAPAAIPAPAATCHIAAGDHRLLLATAPAGIAALGGIEQRRAIDSIDGPTLTATVDRPFAPALRTTRRWRLRPIDPLLHPITTEQSEVTAMFIWDSRDVPGGGEIVLRAQPLDTDFGDPTVATVSIRPKSGFEDHVASLPATPLKVADMNGDGGDDLLVPMTPTGPLQIFRQRPGGSFSTAATAPISSVLDDVAVADLNGDGRADVVTASATQIRISMQRVDGTFDPSVDLTVPGGAASQVAVADLYGDGRPDLVSNGQVFLQPIGGFTAAAGSIAVPALASHVHAPVPADFQGEGRVGFATFAIEGGSLGVSIVRQNATGGFERTALLTPSPAANTNQLFQAMALAVTDFDGDGLPDVAAAYRYIGPVSGEVGDRVVIHRQVAAGGFAERFTIGGAANPALVSGIHELAVADVNGDGHVDLAITLNPTGVTVLFQQPDGGFYGSPIAWTASGVATGDFNADGAPDLLLGASYRLQSSPRVLTAMPAQIAGPAPQTRGSVTAFDPDADGIADLCSGDDSLAALLMLRQQSRGAYLPSSQLPLDPTQQAEVGALLGVDLDGDGSSQLLVGFSHAGAGGVWLDPNSSAGQLLTAAGQSLPEDITVADLDGDGDLDVATAGSAAGNGVGIFRNDSGVLAPVIGLASPAASALAAADLNDDGRMDLAVCLAGGIQIFRQEGNPLPEPTVTIPGSFVGVFAADFSGDGRADIAATAGHEFVVFYQRQDGSFAATPDLAIPDLGTSIAVIDLDGDGRADVIGSNRLAFQVAPGAFTSIAIDYGSSRSDVIAADLDTDGDLEIISVNPTLLIWRGR